MYWETGRVAARSVINPKNRDFILIKDATGERSLSVFIPPPPLQNNSLYPPTPPPAFDHEIRNFLKFKDLYLDLAIISCVFW